MTGPLTHIVEPRALLLVWQASDESDFANRSRRVVARITRGVDRVAKLTYLVDTSDFQAALQQGFAGYPGFDPRKAVEYESETVLEALLRRIPPRKREDFADYLAWNRLPSPFEYSDFALLGYTRALLPGDGFSLVPEFDPGDAPCEYILEVAGVRYHSPVLDDVVTGDVLRLQIEPDNPVEPNAIAIMHRERKLGYVNHALLLSVSGWLATKKVRAVVERKNGKPGRPLVYVRLLIE